MGLVRWVRAIFCEQPGCPGRGAATVPSGHPDWADPQPLPPISSFLGSPSVCWTPQWAGAENGALGAHMLCGRARSSRRCDGPLKHVPAIGGLCRPGHEGVYAHT